MHEVRFSLTGDHLDAVRHLADERAQEYLGPDFEALFTRSRAVPNTNPTNGAALSGWRVTFTYRSRPVPMPFPRRTTPVVVEPALTVEPAGDAPPAELEAPSARIDGIRADMAERGRRSSLAQVAQRDAAGARAVRSARIEELRADLVATAGAHGIDTTALEEAGR